ncbi:hypothetical protein BASA50_007809 [Batrachochytrium salamandrivorans]|uniref:Protein kinase domain-containing protein n=1 Tax=Batrachochytrium salamandrivorans TaxID=1357716 RepID=A0ABQ8F5S2_9FUNG|nr:hypothetical protein BASA50_007809 [Batrachochytrium salamandrivorans]
MPNPRPSRYGDGMQVANLYSDNSLVLFKTIKKEDVDLYRLESTSSLKMHMVDIDNEGGRECKLPKSLDLLLPLEVEMQKYLTQSGYYGSPYVLQYGKLSMERVRLIAREVLKALLSLNAFGVVHGNVAGENILYNEKTGELKLMNFGYSGPLEKWNEDSSATKPSDEKPDFWRFHSILGVENVYTWLRGGVLNGEADLDQRWLDGTVEHESMGTRHDNRALAARLADFLQVAYRQYQSTLWKYHRDRLVEVG